MNKPASELIALDKAGLDAAVRECARITAPEISDEEYEKIVAEDSLRYRNTRLDMERTILAYLSAANQSSERAGVDALRSACERLQRFLDTFGDLGDCVTQADINDWLEQTATVYPWPKALCVYRHESNYWHGDISFARAPTDAEINALGAFLRDHHENTRPLATPPAQPAPESNTPGLNWKLSDETVKSLAEIDAAIVRPGDPRLNQLICGPSEATHGKPDGAVREGFELLYVKRWRTLIMVPSSIKNEVRAALSLKGDVVAMKEACKRAVTELDCMYVNDERIPYGGIPADPESSVWREAIKAAEAAIDRIDVKAEAKSQEPEAVAWLRNGSCDGSIPFALCDEDDDGAFPVYTHPTTKPEAPAVGVESIARLVDPHSFCLRDETDGRLRTVECDEAIKTATAIAALIAGGR